MGKHDIIHGIFQKWPKFLIPAAIALLASVSFLWELSFAEGVTSTPTWMDHLCNLFSGMKEYNPNSGNPFEVPVLYLAIHVFVAFIIGNYPVNDLYDYAPQVLIRTRNRARWWFEKCIWNVASVLLFYLILLGVTFVVNLIAGGVVSLTASADILTEFFGATEQTVNNGELALAAFLLPVLTSIALSLVQMVLMLCVKPVYSYLSIIVLLVSSAYFMTPFLPGNYAMLWRNAVWCEGGISTALAIVVTITIAVVVVVVGYFIFQKKDILDKSESN